MTRSLTNMLSIWTFMLLLLQLGGTLTAAHALASPDSFGSSTGVDPSGLLRGASKDHQSQFLSPTNIPQSLSSPTAEYSPVSTLSTAVFLDGGASLANVSSPFNDSSFADFAATTPYNIVTAVILILTGVAFAFNGHRMFRGMLFIAGFYVFAILAVVVLGLLESRNIISLANNRDLIVFASCIVAGIIGGFLFQCLWKLGFLFIGALLGLALAAFILQFSFADPLQATPGRYIFFGVMAVVGAVLVQLFEGPVLVIATAVVGSGSLFVGIDFFVKSGFGLAVYSTIFQKRVLPSSNSTQFVMMAMFVVVALLGMLAQYFQMRNGAAMGVNPYSRHKPYMSQV
ncbi:hypothetical protein BASA50_005399 [Batrachochytrium salamandrivorans]|uniref:Transmembrane protein 198 n=1 Tax=Batrachochytrium salamandrivorans TaxID=1357716 RepID=A0ABQ8FCW5_9FUNG|nr:hypothetical protein BASA50_005399 [Batrachochytrium salamandrivorans]KAJ1334416.1 hypothetical protein BSLG_007571 [Batrachochytrium salamandrivorans]